LLQRDSLHREDGKEL